MSDLEIDVDVGAFRVRAVLVLGEGNGAASLRAMPLSYPNPVGSSRDNPVLQWMREKSFCFNVSAWAAPGPIQSSAPIRGCCAASKAFPARLWPSRKPFENARLRSVRTCAGVHW